MLHTNYFHLRNRHDHSRPQPAGCAENVEADRDARHARCPARPDPGRQLGHLEFLQVLCEDEIARRETAALARRLRRARFEQRATFEDFDFTANPKLPAAMLRDLAALRWLDAGESVILYGPLE